MYCLFASCVMMKLMIILYIIASRFLNETRVNPNLFLPDFRHMSESTFKTHYIVQCGQIGTAPLHVT